MTTTEPATTARIRLEGALWDARASWAACVEALAVRYARVRPLDVAAVLEIEAPTVAESLSAQVAAIVSRLMAKAAEDRYRSALGIKCDLDRCLDEWTARGTVSAYELAQSDVPHQFLVPQKLFGRDHELGALRRAFEATCAGERTFMLVAGYAGATRGWERLYIEHVLGADTGADLDFLVGASGSEVTRESH